MKKLVPTLMLCYAAFIASAQIDMLNGLQGHYTFNGDVKDETSNHNDGTLHGFAHVNDARLIIGDNLHDYLRLPAAVMNGLGDFTLCFHVAFADFHTSGPDQTNQVICAWGPELDRVGVAYKKSIHSFVFTVNGEEKTLVDNNIDDHALFCMFIMREGDSLKVFKDAVEAGSWLVNTDPLSITDLVVGQHATCADGCFGVKQGMYGHLENLAFWNRALNADEIDLGCHPPHAMFVHTNADCNDAAVDFTNLSEHSDFYEWDFGDGNTSTEMDPSHIYGNSGTYTVTLIAKNQWNHLADTITDVVIVSNSGIDAVITADGSTNICDGSTVTLHALPVGLAFYQWYLDGNLINGATEDSYEAGSSGAYTVLITNTGGCTGIAEPVEVTISLTPIANVEPSDPVSVCQGTSQVYSANEGDFTYQWMRNGNEMAGATNASLLATISGNYSVVVTNSNGCSSLSNTASFTVNPNPDATITADGSTTFCEGGTVNLSATEGIGFSYQWQINGNDIAGATGSSYTAWQAGNYTVNVTSGEGCSATSTSTSVAINENPAASITPAGEVSACAGSGQLFSANTGGGLSYQWMLNGDPINGATNSTYNTNVAGDYSVMEMNSNGCTGTSNVATLTVNANPEVSITPDGSTTFCEGSSVVLTAEGNGTFTYQWKLNGSPINGETDATYTATQSGTYSVKVVDQNGCKNASAPVDVTVNENPAASIDPSGEISFCEGGTQTYNANTGEGLTYQWTWNGDWISGETNDTYTTSSSGSYAVIVWNASGCSTTSPSSSLTVNANPVASIDPSGDIALCDGLTQTYHATEGDLTYQWTWNGDWIDGATNSSYTTESSGEYAVIVWNSNGCSATSTSSNLSFNANPEATIDPSGEIFFCEGGSQTFNANIADLTYQWTWNGDWIDGATNSSYTASSGGTYAVIVWNEAGCSATSSSATVTVNANPEATINPSGNIGFCEGGSQTYTANSGDYTYQWTMDGNPISGETNSDYVATTSGTYAVIVTNGSGCSSTSSSSILTVSEIPDAIATANGDLSICPGTTVELDANTGNDLSYQWQEDGGDISGATDATYEADDAGNYSVVVTNDAGCSATSNSLEVILNAAPIVSLGDDMIVCDTDNVVLDAGAGFESYLWNDGSTGQTVAVTDSMDYWVVVTDANGCTGSDTINVDVKVCTGIDELTLLNGINIYPNPAFGSFVVEMNVPATKHAKIDLVNTLGQEVRPIYEGQIPNGGIKEEVDGKTLAKGVYYVRMNFDDTIVTKKVVMGD